MLADVNAKGLVQLPVLPIYLILPTGDHRGPGTGVNRGQQGSTGVSRGQQGSTGDIVAPMSVR